MDDLIQALQILRKYGNPRNPFHCEHDTLRVYGIEPAAVSDEDKAALDALGFFIESESEECFMSFRFGSC